MNSINFLKYWRTKKFKRAVLFEYKSLVYVSSMSEIPNEKLGDKIYIIERGNINRWLVFDCPRGHNKRIEVNLMKSHYPFWKAQIYKGKISLSPSVAVDDGNCDCHFWLEDNVVYKAYYNIRSK